MPSALSARLRRALTPRGRLNRRRVITTGVVLVLVAGLVGWAVWPSSDPWTTSDARVTVMSGPSGTEPIELDTRFYLPTDR